MTEISGRLATLSPRKRALIAQRLQSGAAGFTPPPIPRRQAGAPVRLSFAQERLWFLEQWQPGTPAHNLVDAIRLSGRLDVAALAAALGEVVRRHESLRTTCVESGGVPFQVVGAIAAGHLAVVDLAALAAPAQRTAAQALTAAAAGAPFDLARGPLLRTRLLRLAADEHLLLLAMHHLVADLWSFGVFIRELATLYRCGRGEPAALPAPAIQYADFSTWQREWLAGKVLGEQLGFWRRQLAGAPLALELPADRPRPPVQSLQGALQPCRLPAALAGALNALAQRSGATLFMALLAGYGALLGRCAGQDDLLVGSPVAGRTREELEPLIGLFVNTLVLRIGLAGDPSLLELLVRVREMAVAAYLHQDVPFARLVEELQPERDPSRPPLVQVLFALQNVPLPRFELPGLTFTHADVGTGAAAFELSLFLTPSDAGLEGAFEYAAALFDAVRIQRLAAHLQTLLRAATAAPGQPLSTLALLSPAERQQLREWNDTAAAGPRRLDLDRLCASQAERRPDATAVCSEAGSLTFRELELASNRLAHWLLGQGIGTESLVGVLLGRSPAMVVALLGALKAGAAYLPLDPSYPAARLSFFIADAAPRLVLTESGLAGRVPPGSRLVLLDREVAVAACDSAPPPGAARAEQLAYVIYTSGSTGRPKGVGVSRRALANFLLAMLRRPGLAAGETLLAVTSLSFDIAGLELFLPLAAGGRIVLAGREQAADGSLLLALLRRSGASALQATPATWQMLIAAGWGERGEGRDLAVLCGGEAMPPQLAAELTARSARVWNLYGPTETTVWSALVPVRVGEEVTVGRPIDATQLHVLDRHQQPLPLGVPGELYIGGTGVARGYLGRPELTAERFVPDPCSAAPGGRLYRTGDLAAWRRDGTVELLGRRDHQVKIRGHRIELGEIEAALQAAPGVRQAVVAAHRRADGELRLVAYVVAGREPPPPAELRHALRRSLPEPMLPAAFVFLAALPLTPGGKLDRNALPEPAVATAAPEAPGTVPRGAVEELLAGLWAELLGRERVGRDEDFFALGGHSLLATRLLSRVGAALGVALPVRSLFAAPTVAGLAVAVAAARLAGDRTPAPPIRRAARHGELPLSPAQERLWFIEQLEGRTLYGIPAAVRLRGALRVEALAAALREVVRRHEALRTRCVALAGRPAQVIDAAWRPSLPVVDLGGLAPDPAAAALERRLAAEEEAPFDLARGPLLRVALVRRAADDHVLLLTMHHLITDGWSMGLLVRELAALYSAAVRGEPSPLAELPVQYADFAIWQRAWLRGEALAGQLAHWRQRLAGLVPLDLPGDRPPAAGWLFRAGEQPLSLAGPLAAGLHALARRQAASLFMVLLAAFQALLRRHTSQDDFAIAAPIANRHRTEIEDLIGCFVNTLLLRAAAGGNPTFGELLARVRETTLAAYDHQDLPYASLVQALRPDRRQGELPFMEVMFTLQQPPLPAIELPGLELGLVQRLGRPEMYVNSDLSLYLWDAGGRVEGGLAFNAARFDPATMVRWRDHLARLLAAAAADPDRRLDELPLLGEGERHQLLFEWSADGEVVLAGANPAPIGIWGEAWRIAPGAARQATGRRCRRRADGRPEAAPASPSPRQGPAAAPPALASVAQRRDEQAQRRARLSPAQRELVERRRRGQAAAGRAGRRELRLTAELSARLRQEAARQGAPLHLLLLAGFAVLLARCSGQDELLIAMPAPPPPRSAGEGWTGPPANPLVLRVRLDGAPDLRRLLAVVREAALVAGADRERAPRPPVQAMVSWGAAGAVAPATGSGLDLWLAVDEEAAGAAFQAAGEGAGPVLALTLELAAAPFAAATAARLLEQLATLLAGAVAAPQLPVWELPWLSGAQTHQVLRERRELGPVAMPRLCLHELFSLQARRRWRATAVSCGTRRLSYGEVERRSNQLGHHLRALGVGPEVLVGLCLQRSVEMVVAILGVLKAGGAYVPIDPSWPPERRAFLLRDAGLGLLLTESGLDAGLARGGAARIDLDRTWEEISRHPDEAPRSGVAPEHLAYVIYTSGSTGRPKGVRVGHGNVTRLFGACQGWFDFGPDDVWTLFHSYAFDFSVWELWGALLHGGRLVVVPHRVSRSPAELWALLVRERVTVLNQTPSAFRQLVPAAAAAPAADTGQGELSLRWVIFGGEALEIQCLRPWWERHAADRPRLVNMYGITETTVHVTCRPLRPEDLDGPARGSIGVPLPDLEAYVLDRRGAPVPVGVVGEICVGGAGLARGYLGRPELEAERLVPHPFSDAPGARLYRSGDLARWLPSGELEYLGRGDHQVKIRGYRIEVGEIEAVLAQHPAVAECVVVVRELGPDDRRLTAYLAAATAGPAPGPSGRLVAELRSLAQSRLPEYMVPSAWVLLDRLPLTANGKVDRLALPQPAAGGEAEPAAAAPRTPAEEMVALIWSRVLGIEQVGADGHFFALGGHSLLASQVMARVQEAFGVALPPGDLFAAPTVEGLARRIAAAQQGAGAAAPPPLVALPRPARPALSFAQQRLWFLDRLAPDSAVYAVPAAYRLSGRLQPAALAAGLAAIVRRHEALRTRFPEAGGEPWQEIAAPCPVPLPLVDLGRLAAPGGRPGQAAPALARLRAAAAGRRFELARGPLLRAVLVRLAADEHLLLLNLHHIVYDGWSEGVLIAELVALYAAAVGRRPSPLGELAVQYADFAAWQRAWPPAVLAEQLAWWRGQLAGAPQALELAADRARPAVQSFRGASRELRLPAAAAAALRQAARREGATLYMLLLAGFAALLARYTGQQDLLIGTPVANRAVPEVEGLIGFFVNTLTLRLRPDGEAEFRRLLTAARDTALAAFAHQDLPFEALVEELRPQRDLARNPLVQVMLALQGAGRAAAGAAAGVRAGAAGDAGDLGEALRPTRLPPAARTTAKFDLSLAVEELEDEAGGGAALALELEWAVDLFTAATAARLLEHYATLLCGAAAAPELPLSRLPLLAPAERHQLLAEWNDTAGGPRHGPWAHELVAAQARRRPEAPAVVAGAWCLSHGELDRRARRLAGRLRRLGVRPEVRAGVCLERSPALVTAVLAVLRAGGAYVALDPAHPLERLSFQLQDSRVPVLLASRGPIADLAAERGIRCLFPDEPEAPEEDDEPELPAAVLEPANLAYVIYTSGSTGLPKGVELSHGSLLNLVAWHRRAFMVTPADRASLIAGVGFDAAVWETWPYLTAGASLHLPPAAVRTSPEQLRDWLVEQRITVSFLPVPLAEAVLDLSWEAPAARWLLTGGDRLHRQPPAALPFPLVNAYGPTEGTVVATAGRVPVAGSGRRPGQAPSLGRPIDGFRAHVVGLAAGEPRLVPVGVPGELLLGGAGLARGYLQRPDRTAERFVPDPFTTAAGERLYRTGDLVRLLADGEIDFLGRIDHQVKIRGFRIELGEIEAVLARHPAVGEAAVLAIDGSLVAFVTPRSRTGAAPDAAELHEHARRQLPEPMIPARFVPLAALPCDTSGKVDRGTLAAAARQAMAAAASVPGAESRRTPVEELVAGVWEEVLGRSPVLAGDNFFSLGGHSLLVTRVLSRLRSTLGVELPVKAMFESPTVSALARAVTAARQGPAAAPLPRLPPVALPRPARPALSFAQQRLWFLDRLAPDSAVYAVPAAYRLSGRLQPAALAAGLAAIVRRHEALRTRFPEAAGEPWQEIAAACPVPLPLVDLGRLAAPGGRPGQAAPALARLRAAAAGRRFELARGPLLRAVLVRLAADEHLLLLNLHHIVYDGWSEGVLIAELVALYAAAVGRRPSPLGELAVQYADFAAWQRAWPPAVLAEQLAWWRGQLAGAPQALELAADRARPAVQSFRGASRELRLPAAAAAALRQAARREGATLYMLLLAGFAALLARYTGQQDLLIGTPVANRAVPEVEGLIGFFVNTLTLRLRPDGEAEFRRLLTAARDTALAAFAHQDLPFEALVEELRPQRDLARNPLVQVMLALQGAGRAAAGAAAGVRAGAAGDAGDLGEALRPTRLPPAARTTAKFDLSLAVEELEDEAGGGAALALELEWAVDLFTAATAARLLEHYATLLCGAAAAPELPLSRLPLLAPAERHQLLAEWNDTASDFPRRTLHRLFAEQVAARPEAVAVVGEEGALTYRELALQASRIARCLRRLGVGPEARVGLSVERSGAMVAAVLGILEAGGAYVPLDPGHPRQRLEQLLRDASPAAIVGSRRQLAVLEGSRHQMAALPATVPLLALEELADAATPASPAAAGWDGPAGDEVAPEGLAYVLYTSGSTGAPKGVEVSHQAVVRLVRDTGYAAFGPGEVFLQLAPMSFDAATLELWGPLLNGGRLALFPPRPVAPSDLYAAVQRHGVTTLWLTAGLFHLAVDEGLAELAGLRQLLAGGDALARGHVERALAELPAVELINGYGPTENTTFSCCCRLRGSLAALGEGSVPIGKPIAGSRVHVLDRALAAVPVGVAGELCVGGAGLARGYLGRPELTAERFVPDPFGGGGRLYRTGDVARWRPEGTLEFLGRRDFQVKVRGFRIELGEVESVLRRHPAVREAVVVAAAEGTGDRRLLAYHTGAGAAAAELRAFLRDRLPEPMVPAAFVALAALPLTPNGKVDRRALPAPEAGDGAPRPMAPLTPVEEVVAGIWEEVLGLGPPGIDDDFFDQGGHSLLVTRVLSRLRAALGAELPVQTLFEHPTVRTLARAVAAARAGAPEIALPPLRPVPRGGLLPASFAQQRLWLVDRLAPDSPTYNIPAAFQLHGWLQPPAVAAGLTALVRRHEALRTRFVEVDGEPWQEIAPPRPVPLALIDLRALPPHRRRLAPRAAEPARLLAAEAGRPFDLARGPLLRAALVRLDGEEQVLLLTLHHIASDGWSEGVLLGELPALCAAAAARRPSPLRDLPVQHADFAAWQRAWPPAVMAGQLGWWRRQLAGAPTALELPADRPRPAAQSFRGASRELCLPAELAARLRLAARREGATLHMLLLAGFAALLARYTGQEDLLIGTPVANRTRPEIEGLIGFFVNTLALRLRPAADAELRQLLAAARDTLLGALANQDLPFEALVEELRPARDLARNPLVQVMLASQAAGQARARQAPPATAPWRFVPVRLGEARTAKFDLSMAVEDREAGLALELEYATDLFTAATAARLLGHYAALLAAVAQDPGCRVSRLPLLSEPERHQLRWEWSDTAAAPAGGDPRRGRRLEELIQDQARRTPAAPAVETEAGEHRESLSYGALNALGNQLALQLRQLGVGPEVVVAIRLERSAAMIVGLLAILKAGGAYLPLDPDDPADRVGVLLQDSGARVLLTASGLAAGPVPPACRILCLDDAAAPWRGHPDRDLPAIAHPDNLAYVLHTSGSTGRPKGVMIAHRAIVSHLLWMQGAYPLAAGDRLLQKTPLVFDASVWELFAPLVAGACLVLARPGGQRDAGYLARVVAQRRITILQLVPLQLRAVLDEGGLERATSLRRVFCGGEALSGELAARFLARVGAPLINLYGPAETTVQVAHHACEAGREPRHLVPMAPLPQTVPVGRPVADTVIRLLDRHGRQVPIGVPGEVHVGGVQLARGYLGQPGLTAERFLPDAAAAPAAGSRLYRTGDVARHLPGGAIEYLGRSDQQVKVRGCRIEPGEVESALRLHAGVREAVVVAAARGAVEPPRLVAYWVGSEESVDGAELRSFLRRRLPEHMVPAAFVALAALPVTAGGKVDRRALPPLEETRAAAAGDQAAAPPRTPVEVVVAGIWEEVLGLGSDGSRRIGIADNFFELGGHSLLATRVMSRLRQRFGVELALRELFEEPRVDGLARRVEAALSEARKAGAAAAPAAGGAAAASPLRPVSRQGELPMSFSQLRQWFLVQLEPEATAYNLPLALSLRGPLQHGLLARCLVEIARRHETLRTTFAVAAGRPSPVIAAAPALPLPLVELGALPAAGRQAECRRLVQAEGAHVFDLTRGPLVRLCLLRLGADEHLLLLTVHHIIFDGWSLGVLTRELAALYEAGRDRRPAPLPELAIQYVDHAAWQQQWRHGEAARRQLEYWRRRLAGAAKMLHLPTDRPRPPVQTWRGAGEPVRLPATLAAALRALGLAQGATPFMALLAGFCALLGRYTRQDDVSVGTFVANRRCPEVEPLLGFFVNTLVLRTPLGGEPSFLDLLARVREVTLGAFEHQDLPFEALLEELETARDLSRTPLFQVMFGLQNFAAPAVALRGLEISPVDLHEGVRANVDLALWLSEDGAALHGAAHYNTDLFGRVTIQRLLSHLTGLLAAAVAEPRRRLVELPILTRAERHQATWEWSEGSEGGGGAAGGALRPAHRLIGEQAARFPERPAVVQGSAVVSYAELDRRAAVLARRLRSLGVGRESVVALCCPRGPAMIAGLLGILEAGAAFLPLDPELPAERLAFLLADAHAAAVLAPPGLPWPPDGAGGRATPPLVHLDWRGESHPAAAPPPAIEHRQLAYVLYTSGSTGRPKGVQVEHGALARFVHAARAAYGLRPGDRVLQFAASSFDTSVEEIFPCLAAGATLVLRDDAMLASPAHFSAACRDWGITVLDLPTAWWHVLAADVAAGGTALPRTLRLVILGGERALPERVLAWLAAVGPDPRLVNTYGPTEAIVVATGCALGAPPAAAVTAAAVPIGRPWGEAHVWLLDGGLQPVPVGVAGELHIAGEGLARGYLGRPELTAERFIPCPFAPGCGPGGRLYRTGDLARYRVDGCIEFVGRIDDQVKIRGCRVEPGEIAAVLAGHPAVREAAVLAGEAAPGDWRLVAYLAPRQEPAPEAGALRDFLAARLPGYMVPSDYVALPALPLTLTGKLDRAMLPAPAPRRAADLAPPQTAVESQLVEIWQEMLGREPIGIEDDLFDLGAHSLLLPRLRARIEEAFALELPLRALFAAPTVAQLAVVVEDAVLAHAESLSDEEAARLIRGDEPGGRRSVVLAEPPLDLAAEAILDPAIAARPLAEPVAGAGRGQAAGGGGSGAGSEPAVVLLSGATGFVGAFLLAELLLQTRAEVRCLVRAGSAAEAASRLGRNLRQYGLWDDGAAPRIKALPGDLSRPLLGLPAASFDALGAETDAIFHCGANVNDAYPYAALKPENVLGTQEMLRLACRTKVKPLHFVSTVDVFFAPRHARLEVLREDDELADARGAATGYAQSKWVADRLVAAARWRGLPASTYRMGRVSWHSRSGAWSAKDPLRLIFDTCLRIGSAPDLDLSYVLSPVDFIAGAIVALARRRQSWGQCFHLVNPGVVHLRQLAAWTRSLGYPMAIVPWESWLRSARRGASAAALPHLEDLPATPAAVTAAAGDSRLDDRNALAGLAGTGIVCPRLAADSLGAYLSRAAGG